MTAYVAPWHSPLPSGLSVDYSATPSVTYWSSPQLSGQLFTDLPSLVAAYRIQVNPNSSFFADYGDLVTKDELADLDGNGFVRFMDGEMPDDIDLPTGLARIYSDGANLTLVVGV